MCCSDRCLIQRYKTYERCDDVTSLTWRRVISHVTLSSPPARCPARTVWRTASWRPSARWTWCRPTAAPWSPSTYSLSAFWNQMQILFCGTRKKEGFYAWNLSFGSFSGQKWVTFVLLRSLITGDAYLWVFTGLYSVFVALKGLPVVGVRHKNKDKDRARWIQTDVEVLIQLWWPLSLTSWRRPPSCRWPSVWVSAPDVWRTRAPASGGPARTSAEHPASRTNPRRWPSRYCREDEERD